MARAHTVSISFVLLLLTTGSCAAPPDPGCRCDGDVPEGRLSIACGECEFRKLWPVPFRKFWPVPVTV